MLSIFKPASASTPNRAKTLQIYLAKEPHCPEWLDSKVKYNASPSACIVLSNNQLTYHAKGAAPITLNKNVMLDGLFKHIGRGWSRLATPRELAFIMLVIATYTTDSDETSSEDAMPNEQRIFASSL